MKTRPLTFKYKALPILEYKATFYRFLYRLSVIQCSGATLHTVAFNLDLRALQTLYKTNSSLELPSNTTFPFVKAITLNLAFLSALRDEPGFIAREFATRFPNIKDVNISYERIIVGGNNHFSWYFESLSAMSEMRRLRIFCPLSTAVPVTTKLVDNNELVCLTRSLVVDYGLNHLEEAVSVHDDWTAKGDGFQI